jgi:hypothetical protein
VSALEFISSVAWPLTVLVIALVFRKSIIDMLSGQLLTRMKAGPFEANWERGVSEVEAELKQTFPTEEQRPSPESLMAELASLAERSPATAVLEAYARIEKELRHIVESPPVDPHLDLDRLGAPALARVVHNAGRLSEQTVQAVEGVSVLRNLVAHGRAGDITRERAKEYLALADGVLYAIRREQQPSN